MSYSEQTNLNVAQRTLLTHIQGSVDSTITHLSKDALIKLAVDIGQKEPYWITGTQRFDKTGLFKLGSGKTATFRLPLYLLDQTVTTKQIKDVAKSVASLPPVPEEVFIPETDVVETVITDPIPQQETTKVSFVPPVDPSYVKFGHHKDLELIIKSGIFYPSFVTGLSGNGKTFMIEQVCAKLNRECIRVNVTIETDEDDLLGGFRLVDGETVFHKGPVVDAMERGAILLLDEVDLASNKILALQPVLEGKGVYLKKINEWITPKEGFNVVATANTKGKGSDSGAFVGTQILNEAFLERFAVTFEQDYPSNTVEKKIVLGVMESVGNVDEDFALHLVKWADIIRKTYHDGGVDEILATRRLVHIATSFGIFKDREKSIDLCIARFDDETKESFKELYAKIDETIEGESDETAVSDAPLDKTPF